MDDIMEDMIFKIKALSDDSKIEVPEEKLLKLRKEMEHDDEIVLFSKIDDRYLYERQGGFF